MQMLFSNRKNIAILLTFVTALIGILGIADANVAHAAFDKITVGGGVGSETDLEGGLFADMNTVLMIFFGIAGFAILACIILAGLRLATAQRNISFLGSGTTGVMALGMALLGGWVVYKALDLAGWIKGLT